MIKRQTNVCPLTMSVHIVTCSHTNYTMQYMLRRAEQKIKIELGTYQIRCKQIG